MVKFLVEHKKNKNSPKISTNQLTLFFAGQPIRPGITEQLEIGGVFAVQFFNQMVGNLTEQRRLVVLHFFVPRPQEHLVVHFGNLQLFSQKPHVLFYRLHLDYDVIIKQARLAVRVEAFPVAVVVSVKLRVAHQEIDEILESGCARQRQLSMGRVASHRAVGGLNFAGKRSKEPALMVRRHFVMKRRSYTKERMTHHYNLFVT